MNCTRSMILLNFFYPGIDKKILSEEVSQFNTSSESYKFLKDDVDLYTVNDLKVKYGNDER